MSITVRIPTAQYAYVEVTGDAVNEVQAQLDNAVGFIGLLGGTVYPDATGKAIQNLQNGGLIPPPGLSSEVPAGYQPPQVQQQAAPQGPSCAHGPRVRRSGTSGRGPWVGWFCPTPKGTPDQCKAEFE